MIKQEYLKCHKYYLKTFKKWFQYSNYLRGKYKEFNHFDTHMIKPDEQQKYYLLFNRMVKIEQKDNTLRKKYLKFKMGGM